MKISIVIPVYNEAEQIGGCLESLAAQSKTPFEVIVVDNNSTDQTAVIAESFNFVKVLREPLQGVVHARNRGFDEANGDIIGRIDADTILPPDWVDHVGELFADQEVAALSGSAHYYDFALSSVADSLDGYFRAHLAEKLKDTNFLWGANMALRRSAWQQVRSSLCKKGLMHEDFDLAIHLQELGFKVDYNQNLNAGVSSRRIDSGFLAYVRYTLRSPDTYAQHNLRSRIHMYPVIFICWAAYLPGRLIYRGYNPVTRSFSLSQLISPTTARVDPTANVIL